ncbi:HAD family phosphatase [Candidatus Dependentiae bacterium]|nr:HAD family phosphatase [Candidatus Dependentiae bacterium]
MLLFKKYVLLSITFFTISKNCYSTVSDTLLKETTPQFAVIFDCDGVLVDSEPNHLAAWQITLKQYNYNLTLDEYLPFVGNSSKNIIQALSAQGKIPFNEEIATQKHVCYQQRMHLQNTIPMPHAIAFVQALKAEKEKLNIVIGLASSSPRIEIMHNLQTIGLADAFDIIVSGRDDLGEFNDPEGTNKPKPYIYQKTAQLLGVNPTQCIVFEDSNAGVTAAHTAGMTVIAVPNEYTSTHDFTRAIRVLNSFDALTIADVINLLPKID